MPEAEGLVGTWREGYDGSAQKGIPAHITVLYPFVEPSVLTQRIELDLAQLFAAHAPFRFALNRTARFGHSVLYLAPEPAEPFARLTEDVRRAYPTHPPYGGAFPDVVPHLSVAIPGDVGLVGQPAREAMARADAAVSAGLPIEATASQVWLMIGNERWSLLRRFALGRSEPIL